MDNLAGALPPWPDEPTASPSEVALARLDDELAELESRIAAITENAAPGLLAAVRALADLHDRRDRARDAKIRDRLDALARVHAALAQLRRMPSAEAMILAAPQQACEACDFDRAVLYRVRGKELIAESFWVKGDPDAAARLLEFSRAHPAVLVSRALETEMVRRRRPLAVQQVAGNPRTVAELAEAYDTHSYVAAPIMPEGRVIGFIHADHRLKPRRVDEFDRDSLWAFAEGFGYAVERAQLTDRLRAQGQELRRLLHRTEAVVAEYLDAEVKLVSSDSQGAGATRATNAILPIVKNTLDDDLTKRELEVLALLGAGASNADIAARLVITADTAKSHVKRILRKLGATNRVEAATMWLQAQQR
jgi:DNA-binding CsgD family transcriptional regulator/putative methionine-R-sulfoxide reductase with GAF domain